MVFLDHGQNLHIHAVRANILMSFSVDFRSEGRCRNRTNFVRFLHLLIDRLIWPVCYAADVTLDMDCYTEEIFGPVLV